MNKKIIAITVGSVALISAVAFLGYKVVTLSQEVDQKEQAQAKMQEKIELQQQEIDEKNMQLEAMPDSMEIYTNEQIAKSEELAAREKELMEREYQKFLREYELLKQQVQQQPALLAKLEREEAKTRALLEELRNTKATDTAEILRLKGELSNLRSILRSYVAQVDSLSQVNRNLHAENQNLRSANAAVERANSALANEKAELAEKVTIAAQLDAIGISGQGLNKKSKSAKKIKDVKKFKIDFTISRNVTAQTGDKSIYVRITTPTGSVLTQGGTFSYENRQLEYSIRKDIEYTGENTPITVYWDVNETLSAGTYRADIFADGNNIGSTSFSFE